MAKRAAAKKPIKEDESRAEEKPAAAPVIDGPKEPEGKPRAEQTKNLLADLYLGMAEKSQAVSPYHPDSMMRPYNPDDLFQKRHDYGIYEEMQQDDQISVCMQLKKDLVLGSGWDIVCEGDSDLDREVKEDLEFALREDLGDPKAESQTDPVLEDMLEEILSAYDVGFSLTEKIFKKRHDGRIGLKCLKTRHPATWLIHTDEFGNVEKYEQRVGSHKAKGGYDLIIPHKALIHYINKPKFQNPYGHSDLRVAYNAWFAKRQFIRFFSIFLEKSASPIPVAKYKSGAPSQAVTDIYNAIKSFQQKTAIAIPDAIEVEFLETKSTGEAYVKGINLFNMFIGRSLFIPDLLGYQGSETGGGSYALGKDQFRVFFKHINRRRETLERIVNQHIIKPMVLYNFGEMEKFPKFKLRPIEDEQAAELAKLWLEAVKGKVYKPSVEEINHFQKLCKFPESEVEFHEPLVSIDPETGKPLQQKAGSTPPPEDGNPGSSQPGAKEPADAADGKASETDEKKKYSSTRYSTKVNFAQIESSMDHFKDQVLADAAPIMKKAMLELQDQMTTGKGEVTANPEKLGKMSIKAETLAELKGVLQANLRKAHDEAMAQATHEVSIKEFRAPLPNQKFLDFLEGESELFVNDWAENLTKAARVRAIQAIKDGEPLSAIFDDLDDEAIGSAEGSIDRFARTKFTEVMNRGRLEYFESTGVVDAYEYSAILDDRTSEICEGLHGKVFKAGREPIPPLHFNCRSLLVPITKYEDWEADTHVGDTPIQKFIDQKKGAGFAKR